jgi:anaerobic selenocysteine-containing dehydrogenase
MLHVILRDGLEDRDFIGQYTIGFDEVAAYARQWDLRKADRNDRRSSGDD